MIPRHVKAGHCWDWKLSFQAVKLYIPV